MIAGFTAVMLIGYNGILDRPAPTKARRAAAGRPLHRREGLNRVIGDALSFRHRAHRPGAPRPGEAARGHRRALRVAPCG